MPEYLAPGVYVEEFESGPRPMSGVSTSVPGFLGVAKRGPTEGIPQLITSTADFKRKYGGYLPPKNYEKYRFLAYATEQFFINGGSRCYVMRVKTKGAKKAENIIFDAGLANLEIGQDNEQSEKYEDVSTQPVSIIKFSARDEGVWGNDIKIEFKATNRIKTLIGKKISDTDYEVKDSSSFEAGDVVAIYQSGVQDPVYNIVNQSSKGIIKFQKPVGTSPEYLCSCEALLKVSYEDIEEVYEQVSFNINSPDFITKKLSSSSLIAADLLNEESLEQINKPVIKHPFDLLFPGKKESAVILLGGDDGSLDKKDMIEAFKGDDKTPGKRTGLAAFMDNDVVSIICAPGVTDQSIQSFIVSHCDTLKNRFAILDMPQDKKSVEKVCEHRETVNSDYAAMYHPWLEIYDPLDKKNIMIPPSGSVAGIYARSDYERGVHKAPANEVVKGILGLDCIYNQGEQSILNPKGVNLIRAFPGQGIRVWGARTCSANSLWKYVNVRRLFIYLEESIKANTNWVVFEPNNELLWLRVQRTIDVFLNEVWRSGALFGSSPEEAYFVNIGRSTMTQADIDNGRLICVIGVAPVKPAEFVIFRLTQKTLDI